MYLYRDRVSTALPSIVYLLYLCRLNARYAPGTVRIIITIFLSFLRTHPRVALYIYVYIYTRIARRETEKEKSQQSSRERACVSNEEWNGNKDKEREGMNEARSA